MAAATGAQEITGAGAAAATGATVAAVAVAQGARATSAGRPATSAATAPRDLGAPTGLIDAVSHHTHSQKHLFEERAETRALDTVSHGLCNAAAPHLLAASVTQR